MPKRELAIDGVSVVYQREARPTRPAKSPVSPIESSPSRPVAKTIEPIKSQVRQADKIKPDRPTVASVEASKPVKPIKSRETTPSPEKLTEPRPKTVPEKTVVKKAEEVTNDDPKKVKLSQKIKSLLTPRRLVVGSIVLAILVVTGYVSYDSWQTNLLAKQVISESSSSEAGTSPQPTEQRQKREGKDRKPLPVNTLKNYKVAADLPRAIFIDKIGAKGRLLQMGVNRDSTIQAPINIYDGGWYNGSAKPGQTGASVLVGHASENNSGDGLFGKLYKLTKGDIVTVEMGNGSKQKYKVVATETVPEDKVDMGKLLLPHGKATRGVNLITCAGSWIGKDTLDQRLIIYTLPV